MKVNAAARKKLVEIGETIRIARERQEISQAALAAGIGMGRENLIRIEKGRTNVTIETLVRLAAGLGLELSMRLSRPR